MSDVVVLLEPAELADAVVTELLRCKIDPTSRVLRAPAHLLGSGLLLDPGGASWWADEDIAGDAVVVCPYSDDVIVQLWPDLTATWVLWCDGEGQLAECERRGHIGVFVDSWEEVVAELIAHVLEPRGGFLQVSQRVGWGPFARRAESSSHQPAPPVAPPPGVPHTPAAANGAAPQPPPLPRQTTPAANAPLVAAPPVPPAPDFPWPELSSAAAPPPLWARPAPTPHPSQQHGSPPQPPLAALSAAPAINARTPTPPPTPTAPHTAFRRSGALARARTALVRDHRLSERLAVLGTRLESRHCLTLGMATSKGGVLKTTHTAGVGLVGDMALAPRGASVAVVEANPDNADLAVDFAVPPSAATVRELVAALESGNQPPRPHTVANTRLEVWPESRQSAGHSHAQIAPLHDFLRTTYTLVIADFNNCLPDRAGGAAPELLDAWAPHVDVWVVPMDCSQKAVIAAAESIDALSATVKAATGGRTPGFVVPLLVNDSGARRDARHRELLQEFRGRGIAVVDVPHVPRVGRAALHRWRLTDLHRGLTAAWVRVLEEAVSAADEVLA